MSEATPVRSACIHVKQLDVAEMSQFGLGLFDHCYVDLSPHAVRMIRTSSTTSDSSKQ
jgi:hypothetical protein